jgi:hypothetical protein
MLRMLSSLGFVCLTLATVALSEEAHRAPGPLGAEDASGGTLTLQGSHASPRIIRIAQKTRTKRKTEKGKESEPADAGATPATGEKAAGTEKGGLSFSRDIAPILVGNCINCHNERAMAKNGKLDLSTIEKIKKGGPHGAIIAPGMPEESHLYLRLTGDETPRMPRGAGNRPLSEASIEKIGEWVKAGAIFDAGLDPKAPIASYASTPAQLRAAELAKLSVAERDKLVETKGIERWKKGNPKETPQVTPGKNFMVFGLLPKERVNSTLKVAEAQYAQILSLVSPQESHEPVEKIGLYVFNQRNHFVEFVRSVENREIDKNVEGSANLVEGEPYVAVVDPLGGRDEPAGAAKRSSRSKKKGRDDSTEVERTLGGLITDTLAVGVVLREGEKAPVWLSLGVGSYFGSRVDPRSLNTQRLRRAAYEQFVRGWPSQANDALGGEGKPESVRAIGFGIIEALASDRETRTILPAFVKGMIEGKANLDETLKSVLGTDRQQFLAATGEFVGMHYGRSR